MAELDGRLFRRVGNRFEAADQVAQEMLETVKDGDTIVLSYRKSRSAKNLAHWHVLLRAALDHLEGFQDADALGDAVKVAVGHVKPLQKLDGEIIYMPKSIAELAMNEDEFKRFKARGIYVLNQLLGFDIVEYAEENYKRRTANRSNLPEPPDRESPPASAYEERE
jgi:hypothetical protein